ncbi:MAG: hypothetical protein KC468_30295, partial [Myxococcales bacterium]|nr:hypothetical protein [Myxococcales bacterium]
VWLEGRCACEAFGGLHVCPLHLTRAKLFVLAVTLAALVLHVPRLRGLVAAWQRIKDIEHLASAAGPERDGIVLVEDGGRPLVFVAGLRRPRLFVERTWWASLERRERDVIAAHERAHIDARDSWTLLTLDLILSLVSPRVRRAILADFTLNAELCADAEAARSDGDPVFVAEVLCRYARAARPAVTAGFGSGDLETRVRSLVGEPTRAPPRRAARARGLTVTMAVCACLLGHLSHRALETLLNALI